MKKRLIILISAVALIAVGLTFSVKFYNQHKIEKMAVDTNRLSQKDLIDLTKFYLNELDYESAAKFHDVHFAKSVDINGFESKAVDRLFTKEKTKKGTVYHFSHTYRHPVSDLYFDAYVNTPKKSGYYVPLETATSEETFELKNGELAMFRKLASDQMEIRYEKNNIQYSLLVETVNNDFTKKELIKYANQLFKK